MRLCRLLLILATCFLGSHQISALTCEEAVQAHMKESTSVWWGLMDQDFKESVKHFIERGNFVRRQFSSNSNYHWETYLKQLKKFGIDPSKNKYPTLKEFLENYERELNKKLRKHNRTHPNQQLSSDDLIQPRFAFYDSLKNKWLILKYGEKIPAGYSNNFFDVDGEFRLVPGRTLYPSIAKGHFPLMVGPFDQEGHTTLVSHDVLGHFLGYFNHFDYAMAYRRVAQTVVERGGWDYLKANPKIRRRVHYFNEGFILTDLSKLRFRLWRFDVSAEMRRSGYEGLTAEHIEERLRTKSRMGLILKAYKLMVRAQEAVVAYGGIANDRWNRVGGDHLVQAQAIRVGNELESIARSLGMSGVPNVYGNLYPQLNAQRDLSVLAQLSEELKKFWEPFRNFLKFDKEPLVRHLARLEAIVLILSRIEVDDWADAIFNDIDSPDNLINRFATDADLVHAEEMQGNTPPPETAEDTSLVENSE